MKDDPMLTTLAEVGATFRAALKARDRAVLEAREAGVTLTEVSRLTGLSIGAIRHICARDGES